MAEHNYIDFDATKSAPDAVIRPVSSSAVRAVRELCTTWARAVKTICLYPPSNPLPAEFRAKFHEALSELLETSGTIVLSVSDGSFSFEGEPVYEAALGEENLAYIFFRDGIREIAFEAVVGREESDRMLEIVAEAYAANRQTVDIASRLWEASLPHLRHYTVDRIAEGTYIEAATDEQLSLPHRLFVGPDLAASGQSAEKEDVAAAAAGDADDGGPSESPYAGLQRERHLHILKTFGAVESLSIAEKSEIHALCRPDPLSTGEDMGLDILLEILRACDEARTIDETAAILERQFEHCTAANRWEMARSLLEATHGAIPDVSDSTARRLAELLPRLADKRHIERLSHFLNANPQLALEPFRHMLELFGSKVVVPVTAMLGTLEHRPARMMVCEFLAAHGRDTVDLIGNFIYDKRWFVVRNVAMILGEIGHERAVSFLRKSAAHADPRVRVETLRAAQRIPGVEADGILRGFLRDTEPDLRKRALRALGQRDSTAAVDDLKALLKSENLQDRDPQELREMLTTYARLGGAEAAAALIALAHRSPIFGRSRWHSVRIAAVRALAVSSESAARVELEILTRDRNRELAETARAARAQRIRAGDGVSNPANTGERE